MRYLTVWNADEEKWYFSIVDVCGVLTDQPDYDHAKNYWKVLKFRLVKEGNESVTNCNQLKMLANDGKMRLTDVVDQQPTVGRPCRKMTATNNRRCDLKPQREETKNNVIETFWLCKIQ